MNHAYNKLVLLFSYTVVYNRNLYIPFRLLGLRMKKRPSIGAKLFRHIFKSAKNSSPNDTGGNNEQKEEKEFDRVVSENERLRDENKKLREENKKFKKFQEENKKLKDRIKDLKIQLAKAKSNPTQSLSTPSSKVFPKSSRPPKGSRPRGAPKGHRGASLKIPDQVDDITVHSPETCPFCGCDKLGKYSEGWDQIVFDIPPTPIQVVRHRFVRRWCPKCKKKVSVRGSETLPRRNYGPNIATTAGFFEELGIPLRTIQLIFKTLYNHKISVPEIKDLSNLIGKAIEPEYQTLKKEVRSVSVVNADETGLRVDGIGNWCWDFVWDDGVVYVIHRSHGKTVPLEVLGKDFQGCLGHDGWRAYNSIGGHHQLDYVHVNRKLAQVEVKRGVEDRGFLEPTPVKFKKRGRPLNSLKEFLCFAERLREIIRDAVKFSEREPSPMPDERQEMYDNLLLRLDNLVDGPWNDADVVRLCKYVYRDRMFTFIIHPEISWENNVAERAVRVVANIRNNTGGRRSRKGADALQAMLSVFETWRKRGLDVYNEAKVALLRYVARRPKEVVVA